MEENQYNVPPISSNENIFLISHCVGPDFIDLYLKIREIIFRFGKIEVFTVKDYIVFKHPYGVWNKYLHKYEYKMGKLIDVHFRKNSIVLAFNTMGNIPYDPKNLLTIKKTSDGCDCCASFCIGDDLRPLYDLVRQSIGFMSNETRIIKINGKFVTIEGKHR